MIEYLRSVDELAHPIILEFLSGQRENYEYIVKKRLNDYVRNIVLKYTDPIDDVSQIVFHFDRKGQTIFRITLVDSGLGSEKFSSNLSFEGQISELHDLLKTLKKDNQGLKMRNGKYMNKFKEQESEIKDLKRQLKEYEKNRSQ